MPSSDGKNLFCQKTIQKVRLKMYEIIAVLSLIATCGAFCAFCYIVTKDDKELYERRKEKFD